VYGDAFRPYTARDPRVDTHQGERELRHSERLLTLDTSGGPVTGTLTDGTELEWDGDCDGHSDASTVDLQPLTGNELQFVDD
jgi:hypothetical protein